MAGSGAWTIVPSARPTMTCFNGSHSFQEHTTVFLFSLDMGHFHQSAKSLPSPVGLFLKIWVESRLMFPLNSINLIQTSIARLWFNSKTKRIFRFFSQDSFFSFTEKRRSYFLYSEIVGRSMERPNCRANPWTILLRTERRRRIQNRHQIADRSY